LQAPKTHYLVARRKKTLHVGFSQKDQTQIGRKLKRFLAPVWLNQAFFKAQTAHADGNRFQAQQRKTVRVLQS
jgi:hypothetical protein